MKPNEISTQEQKRPVGAVPAELSSPTFQVRPDGSVLLVRPHLELHGDIFWIKGNAASLSRYQTPDEAVVVGGMILVPSLNIALPLSYVHIIRWGDAPKSATS